MGSSTPERTEDGVIPRALRVLFAMCTARASANKHTISLSYIEFYNNTFKDLLDKNNLPGTANLTEMGQQGWRHRSREGENCLLLCHKCVFCFGWLQSHKRR